MILALHILLKDLRRHRWEIALYLVSIVGWSWQQAHPNQWIRANAGALFPILMFVVWFLLVIRVVQGESLTGTREFWSTRPYRAGQLLPAKLAFVVLCIHVPLFLAEYWLLAHAGMAITGAILFTLVLLQLEFFFMLTLPAAALAAITASIVQWVLGVIGALLVGWMLSWFPWESLPPSLEGTELLSTAVGFAVIASLLVALILWQYNLRRPDAARVIFGSAVLVIPLCILIASTSLLRIPAYPSGSNNAPLQLTVSASAERKYARSDFANGQSEILFPVDGSSTSQNVIVVVEGMRFQIAEADDRSSESKWTRENIDFESEPHIQPLNFFVPSDVADLIAAKHSDVEVELALALYRLDDARHIDTSSPQFDVPGLGSCKWNEVPTEILRSEMLNCTTPLRLPDVYTVQLDSAENTCNKSEHAAPLPPGHRATAINFGNSGLPVEFDPNPIRMFIPFNSVEPWIPLIPKPDQSDKSENLHGSICRGTPFVLRTGRFQERMRVTIPLGTLGKENRTPTLGP